MHLFNKYFSSRSRIMALAMAVLVPVGLSLSACSEAPNQKKETASKPPSEEAPGSGRVAEKPVAPEAAAPKPSARIPSDGDSVIGGAARPPQPERGATSRSYRRDDPTIATAPPPPPSPAPAAVDPSKAYDVVPVYYGTDRTEVPNAPRLDYGPDRAHKLQLGRALISVPKAHKVPHIERPWKIEIFKVKIYEEKEDPNKHFVMQEIAGLSEAQLLAYVKERLAQSQTFKDHAFVFIHGFNTSFDAALYRTAQIAYDLNFDGAPFVYSWPSGGGVANYTYDRGSAEQAEPHLAEFLDLVVKKSGAKAVSLIAHSMGNEILLRVLERMRPTAPDGVVISQVILAAPDVDADKFRNIAREITNFSKGVTLYAASNDRALGYSARFWGGVPRAGDVPAGGPLIVPGVDTIDVTSVSTDALGLNHSGYAENPELLNDVKALIHLGIRPPDVRYQSLIKVDTEKGAYWKFSPSR
jgi:esterase/lipase superfamily enzyme